MIIFLQALPGNGDGNSINSFCDRACVCMGEGKTNFVSSLRLEGKKNINIKTKNVIVY